MPKIRPKLRREQVSSPSSWARCTGGAPPHVPFTVKEYDLVCRAGIDTLAAKMGATLAGDGEGEALVLPGRFAVICRQELGEREFVPAVGRRPQDVSRLIRALSLTEDGARALAVRGRELVEEWHARGKRWRRVSAHWLLQNADKLAQEGDDIRRPEGWAAYWARKRRRDNLRAFKQRAKAAKSRNTGET